MSFFGLVEKAERGFALVMSVITVAFSAFAQSLSAAPLHGWMTSLPFRW
jgi:hypothetical protein